MEYKRQQLRPTPPRPYHAELDLPIRLADDAESSESDEDEMDVKGEDKVPTTLSQEYVASATQDIEIEPESDTTASEPPPPPPPLPTHPKSRRSTNDKKEASPSTSTAAAKPKDDRIVAAETWLVKYSSSRSGWSSGGPKSPMRAAPAAMRAYHIWHSNTDLDVAAVAALLRDPPLQTSTVVGYILAAIKLERLPYRKDRLRDEVLALLPPEALMGRYKALCKACEMRVG